MEKNKFRVLVYIPIFCFILLFLGVGFFWFAMTHTDGQETFITVSALLLSIVILPLVLFIWSFITMWPCVKFTEDGIEKSLVNKKIRYISWNDVFEIKRINTGIAEWLFFSKVSLEGKSIDKCRRRKDNIFIVSTNEIEEVIKHFAPSRLLEK